MHLDRLSNIRCGERCKIMKLDHTGAFRRRLMDLGMIPGTAITVIHCAPSGSPVAIGCRGTLIALRRKDCGRIWVQSLQKTA